MKTLKYILSLALIFFISCSDDDSDLSFVESVTAPTNVTALFTPTTDNSGVIKITPNSEGALTYRVSFGDDSVDPANVDQGESVSHTYAEGTYTVNIVAIGITGLETGVEMELPVSFSAPIIEDSDIIIVPSETISYGVEVTVENVEYGISYEVYFGENASTEPDEIANVGDTVYYVYGEAGIYTNVDFVSILDDSIDWNFPETIMEPYDGVILGGSGEEVRAQ